MFQTSLWMSLIPVGVSMSPVLTFLILRPSRLRFLRLRSSKLRSSKLYIRATLYRLLATVLLNGAVASVALAEAQSDVLTLDKAVTLALQNDPWLSGSRYQQRATEALAESAYQLPDPKFSLALANLPTDTFDFKQEAMTQLVVGVSQMYPRGDSRRLKREQLTLQSASQPLMRQERQAKLQLTITQLWLEAYQAKQSVQLIQRDRNLFDQLVDISQASYSSGLRGTGQQDLIKAQLEQSRIEDRLTLLLQKQDMAEQKLLEWLLPALSDASMPMTGFHYATELPLLRIEYSSDDSSDYRDDLQAQSLTHTTVASHLTGHPSIQIVDQSIAAAATAVQLAKQKYKPEWGVSASYGYRGEDAMGRDRADLFSAGVSVTMPLFSTVSQDKEVEAAIASQEKIRTERSLMLRQMIASFNSARAQLSRLQQRQQIFDDKLLPQVKQQADAALHAYESDNGSFIEVVRARIAELNTRIDYLDITVARLQQIAQLNYLLTTTESATDSFTYNQPGVTHE